MLIIQDVQTLREFVKTHKSKDNSIGLVATMGYLHAGHKSLMQAAKESCDVIIASIFVNPLQFGANEDLGSYPRSLDADISLCESVGINAVFVPNVEIMYPNGGAYARVSIGELEHNLCGASRPGHFTGVCTVVSKLFNLVTPDKAFFGQKDIQQLRIIERMVNDLNFPLEVIGCVTVRADDGLALSSRNSYLSESERCEAVIVPNLLRYIVGQIDDGERDVASLLVKGRGFIQQCTGARLDYLQIVDNTNLQALDVVSGSVIIATAIFIGKTRLIDNVIYEVK